MWTSSAVVMIRVMLAVMWFGYSVRETSGEEAMLREAKGRLSRQEISEPVNAKQADLYICVVAWKNIIL